MFGNQTPLPPDILTKELLPFLDATTLVRLSSCSKTCRSSLSASAPSSAAAPAPAPATNQAIGKIWQKLHTKRWKTSSRSPSEIECWYDEYKRRHLLDATVRSKLRSPHHGANVFSDPAWRYLLLQGGLDIVDRLNQFANSNSDNYVENADEFEREVAETALVAINRLDVVRKWRALLLASTNNARQHHIEDGAILIARFYLERERVRQMTSLAHLGWRMENDLNYHADRLSRQLMKRYTDVDQGYGRYVPPILGVGGYPLLGVLEEMQHVFRGTVGDGPRNGFFGNEDDYYDHKNSLLDYILEDRKGIPITLSIVYVAIVRRATGITIDPIGLPGHFILGTRPIEGKGGEERYFIDAFRGGEILTLDQVKDIVASYSYPWNEAYLQPVPYSEVWERMLRNLQNCHARHPSNNNFEANPALRAMIGDAGLRNLAQQLGDTPEGRSHQRMMECIQLLFPSRLQSITTDEELVGTREFERRMCS